MKKTLLCTFATLFTLFLFQTTRLEARHHHHQHHRNNARIQIGLETECSYQEDYVVRRYARPLPRVVYVTPPAVTPVYVVPPAGPTPVYIYPRTQPYVEEVYVARPLPVVRSTGLSFFLNFFK